MPERVITAIFFALCLGQVWALSHSRLAAVIYFIWVATLPYFSFWMFVTWDPSRVCGIILALGGLVLYRRPESVSATGSWPLWIFFAYVVFLTLTTSMFWPVEAMHGRSAAYGTLRPFIQIFNWGTMIGVAWQIAQVLSTRGAFETARRWFIILGIFHITIALYQLIAYETGLPITGIRRVAVGVGLTPETPHISTATIGGVPIFRPTSFAGEPRSLASASMLWITSIFTIYAQGYTTWRIHLVLLLSLLVLFLTFSTSGWGGILCCLALAAYLVATHRKSRWFGASMVLLLFFGVLLALDASGLLPEQVTLIRVIEKRWMERIANPFLDLPVAETLKILSANPQFVIFGAGAGGMSFYIAENLGGQKFILAATIGWVNFIGDLGLVGLVLMLAIMWGGMRNFIFPGVARDDVCRYMSFMGTVFLCQYMIYAGMWMLATAFGFFLASEFRSKALGMTSPTVAQASQTATGG